VNNKVGIQDTFSNYKAVEIKNTRVIGSLSNTNLEAGLKYTYNNQMQSDGQVRNGLWIMHYKKKHLHGLTFFCLRVHMCGSSGNSQA
jgi:hypothetical protein